MWLFVSFDLPTETKQEKKSAARFRKELLNYGFTMFQFSIYLRHCPSREHALMQQKRVQSSLPKYGKVMILSVTDKQFGDILLYHGRKEEKPKAGSHQLSLF
jgi:CRISPR-associated protein Cas2